MPRLTFITPAALVLLALLPLMWAFALLTPRRVAPWRFWLALVLRSLMLAALVLGLAGAQLVQPVSTLTTIFLIDASDSVAPAQRERAVTYVDQALRAMPPADKAADAAGSTGGNASSGSWRRMAVCSRLRASLGAMPSSSSSRCLSSWYAANASA